MPLDGDLLFASSKSPTIGPREDYEVNLLEGEGRRNEGFIESSQRYLKVEYHILNLVNLFYLFLFSLNFWGKYRDMTRNGTGPSGRENGLGMSLRSVRSGSLPVLTLVGGCPPHRVNVTTLR